MTLKMFIIIAVPVATLLVAGFVVDMPSAPETTTWEVKNNQATTTQATSTATTTDERATSTPEMVTDEREVEEREVLAGLPTEDQESRTAANTKTEKPTPATTASATLIDATRPPPGARAPSPILAIYPFADSNVTLAEGFSAYDGILGDTPGDRHRGIDYVLLKDGVYQKFDTFAMRSGEAWQGESDTWGKFVIIRHVLSSTLNYYTIYGHLESVPAHIPRVSKNPSAKVPGIAVSVGTFLGKAGISGNAQAHVPQLHIELHEENLAAGTWLKVDPYHVYGRASSGKYPQPGESLADLNHWWTSDRPPLAQ